jgi:phosphomannomutase
MNRIKFGTDGWRAIIARDYTVENVARLSMACSTWLLKKFREATVVIGYDTRFGGEMFAITVAKILGSKGIKVILSDRFTTTPVVSFVVNMMKAELGIMISASHNPAEYNGFKLKGSSGGPLMDEDIKDIETFINYDTTIDLDLIKLDNLIDKDLLTIGNIEDYYIQNIRENFEMDQLEKFASSVAFEPMYGSSQDLIEKIVPGIKVLHKFPDPMFGGMSPEPLEKNLTEFIEYVRNNDNIKLGVAVDGDADRIALIDEDGTYIDSHHIILLLIHYLAGYRQMKGLVITGFSSSIKIEKLAKHYKLEVVRVKIGFKEITRHMMKSDVLVGGEESGGIGIKGHIPERDGIWIALNIMKWMQESGKTIRQLINEIYEITGAFSFCRSDLHISKELKSRVLENCYRNKYEAFGNYNVLKKEDMDGYKYYFEGDSWLMIRASGTEPVLRTYSEASSADKAKEIIDAAYNTIINS